MIDLICLYILLPVLASGLIGIIVDIKIGQRILRQRRTSEDGRQAVRPSESIEEETKAWRARIAYIDEIGPPMPRFRSRRSVHGSIWA